MEEVIWGETDSSDEEAETIDKNDILSDEDDDGYEDAWKKFFKPNTDSDDGYSKELLQNIDEAKSVVCIE